jgi:histidine triad (HIT) family protein
MEKQVDNDCLFCQIINGDAPSVKVWENDDFLAIENKYPEAPIDILVMPKSHIEKSLTRTVPENFWNEFMAAIWAVAAEKGYDKAGYKLENNGAGYNHFEHEHMHILSGIPKS